LAMTTGTQNNSAKLGGIMPVRGLLGGVVTELGCRIVSGVYPAGETLPIEARLIAELGVSRSVVREAVRILSAKGLVRSRQMDGTRVLERHEWRHLDPDVIRWRMMAGSSQDLLRDLLMVRLVLEPAVVRHATLHATPERRKVVDAAFQALVDAFASTSATPTEQRDAYIAADLGFHRALLAGIGSELLDQLFSVIEAALALLFDVQLRARGAARSLQGAEEGKDLHIAVYAAFKAGDAAAAESAMRQLIEQAIRDADKGFARIGSRPAA
jgi:GntR family transcriptional regulator, galactonate operon transcriptional repressor